MATNQSNNTVGAEELRRSTFLVVPAYNEGPALEGVVRELRTDFPNVIVVDDGSDDDTFEVAHRCASFVLRHLINRGQGAALQTGITFALARGARFVVTFDADGQHRVDDIHVLLAPILDGECDITMGSRFLGNAENIPSSRRRVLQLAVLFTRIFNRVQLTDAHNGLRAFSRRAAEKIDITLDRMAHASEIIDQIRDSGLPFREVPVQIRYTEYSLRKAQSARSAVWIALQYLLKKVLE